MQCTLYSNKLISYVHYTASKIVVTKFSPLVQVKRNALLVSITPLKIIYYFEAKTYVEIYQAQVSPPRLGDQQEVFKLKDVARHPKQTGQSLFLGSNVNDKSNIC